MNVSRLFVFRFSFAPLSMSTFQSFEDIEAWKESRLLVRSIREICRKDVAKRDFPFVDQVTRSARSVSANIAEGYEAMTIPEFITYLGHAKRSAGEVRSHLYDALEENYISSEEFSALSDKTKKISSMIARLIHYLQSLDQKRRRTSRNITASITRNQQTSNEKTRLSR